LLSLREALPLAFVATSNHLTLDSILSALTPLPARSQWNLRLPSAQDEGEAQPQLVLRILDRIDPLVIPARSTSIAAMRRMAHCGG
jgi:hypothetical protein